MSLKHKAFAVKRFVFLWVFGVLAPVFSVAEDTRPNFQSLRYNEDWSVLKDEDREAPKDFFDPIKFIALNPDGTSWVSLGGQLRGRTEIWNHFDFGSADDIFYLSRIRLHADVHVTPYLRGFIEGKSSLSLDRDLPGGRRTLDVDVVDIQNGFVDIRIPFSDDVDMTLRGGRQELLFGKERLVSPLDWANTRRTFEGFSGILHLGLWNFHGFWTALVPVEKYDFNERGDDTQFFGLYVAGLVPRTNVGIDIYWLGLDREKAAFNGTTGKELRHTIGTRISGKVPGLEIAYDVEGAYQLGEVGSMDIRAFMVTGDVSRQWRDMALSPQIVVGMDYASGDESFSGDVETFNQLFPLGHAYLGWIDIVGRQNIVDFRPGLILEAGRKVTIKMIDHWFWRPEENDALYNAGGVVVREGSPGSANFVGHELDLLLVYKPDRHWEVLLGYSHFFAGDFIEESGSSEDMDFAYLSLQYTF